MALEVGSRGQMLRSRTPSPQPDSHTPNTGEDDPARHTAALLPGVVNLPESPTARLASPRLPSLNPQSFSLGLGSEPAPTDQVPAVVPSEPAQVATATPAEVLPAVADPTPTSGAIVTAAIVAVAAPVAPCTSTPIVSTPTASAPVESSTSPKQPQASSLPPEPAAPAPAPATEAQREELRLVSDSANILASLGVDSAGDRASPATVPNGPLPASTEPAPTLPASTGSSGRIIPPPLVLRNSSPRPLPLPTKTPAEESSATSAIELTATTTPSTPQRGRSILKTSSAAMRANNTANTASPNRIRWADQSGRSLVSIGYAAEIAVDDDDDDLSDKDCCVML